MMQPRFTCWPSDSSLLPFSAFHTQAILQLLPKDLPMTQTEEADLSLYSLQIVKHLPQLQDHYLLRSPKILLLMSLERGWPKWNPFQCSWLTLTVLVFFSSTLCWLQATGVVVQTKSGQPYFANLCFRAKPS